MTFLASCALSILETNDLPRTHKRVHAKTLIFRPFLTIKASPHMVTPVPRNRVIDIAPHKKIKKA